MPLMSPTTALLDELALVNDDMERRSPLDVVRWTVERFGDDVVMACSFEDLALLHMINQVAPAMEIVFLDTGGHFPETLEFVRAIEQRWSLNLTRTNPGLDASGVDCGTEGCCALRKVAPLQRAVQGRAAWISAVKRVDAPSRAAMKVLVWDEKFGLVKVNPLATWSDDDVAYYLRANDLPEHPLWAEGYASIGCASVTTKPDVAGDRRSGRWAGLEKEECGLHEA